MTAQFIKNRAFMEKLKEGDIPKIDFDLAGSAQDYNLESLEEEILLPQPKPQEELNRIKEENFETAKPFLMDESVDFIEREEFDRGGVAKVLSHLDSLPEGTDIDLEYIRKYIADNNIDANAKSIIDQLEPNKINRKQIAASGNETFTYKKEKRDLLTRLNKKLNIKKLKEFVPATKENLEKLDNLIKNTDLNIEQIGKELGFKNPKSFKFAPTTKNVLVKEYIKKYGSPPEGRFKIKKLTPDTKIVKEAIRLKELGLSTTQVANELNIDRAAIVNYFRAGGRDDLVGQVNPKKEGTPESRKKAARMANIKEGEKFASKADKAFNKAEDLRVKKINTFLKNNSDQLVNNQKFINLVNLKLDGKGNIISKNKSPDEITKLLKKDRLFERDHISSVAKRKRNMQFPVNFQMAPYNINQGFFGAAEAYVNRPDADPEKIKKISNVLDQYGLRLSTNKGIIGAKQIPASEVIDRNLKALDLPTDIGKEIKIPMQELKKKSVADTLSNRLSNRLGMNVDPEMLIKAVDRNYLKPLPLSTSRKAANLARGVAKFTGAEAALAPIFGVIDTKRGLTPKEIGLNIATLGTGVPIKDALEKSKFIKDLGFEKEFASAVEKRDRGDRALESEVEQVGVDTPATEFAKPEYTTDEKAALLAENYFNFLKEGTRLEQKKAYEEDLERSLKTGELEVGSEETVPEPFGVKAELLPDDEEPEIESPFGLKAADQFSRDFMAEGGIMRILKK